MHFSLLTKKYTKKYSMKESVTIKPPSNYCQYMYILPEPLSKIAVKNISDSLAIPFSMTSPECPSAQKSLYVERFHDDNLATILVGNNDIASGANGTIPLSRDDNCFRRESLDLILLLNSLIVSCMFSILTLESATLELLLFRNCNPDNHCAHRYGRPISLMY